MRAELCALLLVAGCEGALVMQPTPPVDEASGRLADGGTARAPDGADLPADACGARVPARLSLLNDLQHVSAVRALLGEDALQGDELPIRQLKPFAQKGLVVNTSLLHTRGDWASDAAGSLRAEVVQEGCGKLDDGCARAFLSRFVERAFRREVAADELSELTAVYELGAEQDVLHGVRLAVQAILSAPSFAYRRELGQDDGSGSRRLDAFELAGVLSFALTDAPPDDALWQAALDGSLVEPAVTAAQLDRMLALPAVRESLTGTLMASWGLGNIFGAAKDPSLFPSFSPQLQASMYHETELMVQDVLWTRAAPVHELLLTQVTFADGELAKLYGLPQPDDASEFARVELPADRRAGLLTQPSVLAMLSRSDTTSVVARGLFVRGLLCMQKVPSPPESLSGEIGALLQMDMSERERAEVRAMNPTCAGCHTGIDPFGLLLETYDPLGRYRDALEGEEIDTKVSVPKYGEQRDAISLMEAVAQDDAFPACVAARVLSYALQEDGVTPSDCQVEEVMAEVDAQELTMPELVKRVLTSVALATRSVEPGEPAQEAP